MRKKKEAQKKKKEQISFIIFHFNTFFLPLAKKEKAKIVSEDIKKNDCE
jgi:hypothetical protein